MSVMLAYLHPDTIAHNFMHSVLGVMIYEQKAGRFDNLEIVPVRSGPFLSKSRNSVSQRLLDSDHEWLWFVDSDVGFYANTLENLLAVADKGTRPVVGAMYMMQYVEIPDGLGGWIPRVVPGIFNFTEQFRLNPITEYPQSGLIQVDATGAGCILIHRSVLAAINKDWFTEDDGLGEDVSFCKRLKKEKIPLYIHTGIKTSHQKFTWLRG